MKHMRKILALLVAVVMTLAMSVTAFAEGEGYTITAPSGSTHTYKVLQIFKGDLSSGKLINVKWGKNGTGTENNAVDQTILDTLSAIDANAADSVKLETIKNYVSVNDNNAYGEVTDGHPLTGVPAGYYLIKDLDNSVTGEDAYTTYIVKVVNSVTITPKSDVPSSEKKVKDINDSKERVKTGWQETADYDVGDEISYKIEATLPDDAAAFGAYKTYFLNFVDDMSKGLTYKTGSSVVYVNGEKIEDYTLEPADVTGQTKKGTETYDSSYEGGKVYKWSIADVKAAPISAVAGSKITIEYTCTLDDDAVIGKDGNPNKMHIEFDNNPNSEGTGEFGETPDDVNIVFTYKVVVDKIDQDYEPLNTAGFTLYKFILPAGDSSEEGSWVPVGQPQTGVSQFEWLRIDDGKYKLVESTVPDGYNPIPDIEFEITATHTNDPETLELTAFTVDNDKLQASLDAGTINRKKTGETHSAVSGEIYGEIINQQGSSLPETGGVGTTMFYVIGAILVIGAGVVLVTRRRMA